MHSPYTLHSTEDAKEVDVTFMVHTKTSKDSFKINNVVASVERSIQDGTMTKKLEAAQMNVQATDKGLPAPEIHKGESTGGTGGAGGTTIVHKGVSSGMLAAIVVLLVGALFGVAVGSKYYMHQREVSVV
jgi:hypothetical protein